MSQGVLTFRCGQEAFELNDGGFVFLRHGMEHGYTIRGDGDVHLLAVTSPAQDEPVGGWGGFVADIEAAGQPRATPPAS